MKVNLGTITVDDRTRRALAHYYGEKGLATRQSVRDAIMSLWEAHKDDLWYDLDRAKDRGEE